MAQSLKIGPWRFLWLGFQFSLLWLLFMAIIFIIAMLINIDWSRNRLEALLTETIHRKFQLGHLSWTFGLNGLCLTTNRLSIQEYNGRPFFHAGVSEIGIAVTSLFGKELKIRHLNLNQPELWAVRIRPGIWNFSDLLTKAQDVNYLQADSGKIHFLDASN